MGRDIALQVMTRSRSTDVPAFDFLTLGLIHHPAQAQSFIVIPTPSTAEESCSSQALAPSRTVFSG